MKVKKINKKTLFVAVFIILTALTLFFSFGVKSVFASADIGKATTYTIKFTRNYLKTEAVDLRENLNSVTIVFYDENGNYLDSRTRARLDYNNWTDNSSATYYDATGKASYYTISYSLKEGTYDGVYWKVVAGGVKYITDGSGTATTNKIALSSTIIECCNNVMYLQNYEYLDFTITESVYYFPWYYSWKIDIKNLNPFKIDMEYLCELCFVGDAKIFGGNVNNHIKEELNANSFKNVVINHNGTAGYATASYVVNSIVVGGSSRQVRLVSYANNLKYSNGKGTCIMHYNSVVIN